MINVQIQNETDRQTYRKTDTHTYTTLINTDFFFENNKKSRTEELTKIFTCKYVVLRVHWSKNCVNCIISDFQGLDIVLRKIIILNVKKYVHIDLL